MLNRDKQEGKVIAAGTWILILISVVLLVGVLCAGVAYTEIKNAKVSAAKANLGQIESVFLMAEMQAKQAGLAVPENGVLENMLKSYSNTGGKTLTPYEQYIQDTMMDYFGNNRSFDFAISRYQDSGGIHIIVYYFPIKGKNDTKNDQYFLVSNGEFSTHNF